jgi:hypothetical protein
MNYKKIKRNIFRMFLFGFAFVGFVFSFVYIGMQFGWFNVKGSVSDRNSYFNAVKDVKTENKKENINIISKVDTWAKSDDWALMKEVFTRDEDIIKKAARDAGISPRLILSCVMGEQFRFFSSRRESFKSYFEPLKILASLSNTSFGIAGLKPKTIRQIEDNLKNKNSQFYLGENMEHFADYEDGVDIESERMNRITNSKDPYYSYLYVGLYLREIIAQWQREGYDISNRPEILATLYNLGFYYSIPKENPLAGGSVINIDGVNYTFGDIAYEFYYSEELSLIYPIDVQ